MRFLRAITASALLLTSMGWAQGVEAQQQPAPQKKAKRVISNEDLSNLSGAVNVVGEGDSWKSGPAAAGAASAATGTKPVERASDENCNTRGLAMGISAALRAEGVMMGKGDILDRLYGGDVCRPDLGNVAVLLRRMEGDFTLDTGRRIHIALEYLSGPPRAVELIQNNEKNRHYLMFIKGIAYVHTGVEYTEITYASDYGEAGKDYAMNAITLLDPYRNRTVVFRGKENEIDGSVLFTVSSRQ